MNAAVDVDEVLAEVARGARGRSAVVFFELDRAVVTSVDGDGDLVARLYPEARDLVDAHRLRGDTVVLVSSAPPDATAELVEVLGVESVVEADDVAAFAARWRADLGQARAYAGTAAGLAMLELVGTPYAVNPDSAATAAAERAGWPVLRFGSRGRPGLGTIVRSAAAYGMMVPSMLSGAAVGLINRDRHEIAQFGVNTWIDRMFALTGVKLRVHGEENLWKQRPAVFVYNHRNNFDPYVAIKLVRRDWGSVGKKELAGPILPLAQWLTPNVAYVDRSSNEKAVESLAPVTDLLARGVSVLIAPEGTRSSTGRLGPFKKGPFRMAMTAGVPVAPIVIRNADRVASRGAGVIRSGTIDVAVLPPVDVTGWTPADLDERIAEVRQSFIDTLERWPD